MCQPYQVKSDCYGLTIPQMQKADKCNIPDSSNWRELEKYERKNHRGDYSGKLGVVHTLCVQRNSQRLPIDIL